MGGEIVSMEFKHLIDEEELIIDCEKLRGFALHNSVKDKIEKIRDKFIDQESKKHDDWSWKIESLIYRFVEILKKEI